MPDGAFVWELKDFLDRLDDWIALEAPPQSLVHHVTSWIMSRGDNPYQGVQREPGFDNLWYGVVPRSGHDAGSVVVCSYFVFETTRVVRCNSFATLNWPA